MSEADERRKAKLEHLQRRAAVANMPERDLLYLDALIDLEEAVGEIVAHVPKPGNESVTIAVYQKVREAWLKSSRLGDE